ncbi:MAG TPA: amidohydrolase, partial [Chromatiales bacterium]|nr:amidohydrolase [Chromatiales bacterium]
MHRLSALLLSLLPFATAIAVPVSLHEGTRIAVSASHGGERISMDLAGRIWLVDPGNGLARGLTPPGRIDRRPALSPDGSRIVYESRTGDRSQLWLVDTAGGQPRQITFGGFDHHSPAWHPDGHQIVMVSNRSGNDDLWALNIDSLELQQLSFSTGNERDPAYSADGSRIAYVMHDATG